MIKHRKREPVATRHSAEISRRYLLLASLGGATAIGALMTPEPVLATHFGTPHIVDVVTDFGAVGEGVADDTFASQAATTKVWGAEVVLAFRPGRSLKADEFKENEECNWTTMAQQDARTLAVPCQNHSELE